MSGSEPVFLLVTRGILVWAFLGVRFGGQQDWQIAISDVQAIVTYIFDSFLMRQQLSDHVSLLRFAACLQSRNASNKRMLKAAVANRVALSGPAKTSTGWFKMDSLPTFPL